MAEPRKFWGTRLNDGVLPKHLFTFYVAAFSTIMLAVALNTLQPYLFQTFLGLEPVQFGGAGGRVGFVGEVVLVLVVGTWGVLSDRIGRRSIYALGFLVMALGYAITPFSDSLEFLMGTRAVYAVGIGATTAMLATIGADYIQNQDRGKGTAIMGIMNGLGAVTAALGLAKLPAAFQAMGQDGISAGWSAFLVCAGLCVLLAVVVRVGLKGTEDTKGARTKGSSAHGAGFAKQATEGLRAAKRDIGVTLSYAAAFVARADLAVAGVFLPLWLTKHYVSELSPETKALAKSAVTDPSRLSDPAVASAFDAVNEAAATGIGAGGMLIAVVGTAGLMFAPVIGILCDRIHRVNALAFGLFFNFVGYGLTFFVVDPTGPLMIVCAAIIGFGQVGGVISSQVLVQQQAPARTRGAVVGAFNTSGALGIMFCLVVGGELMDLWTNAGPFVLLAVLNALVILGALAVRRRVAPPMEEAPVVGDGGAVAPAE